MLLRQGRVCISILVLIVKTCHVNEGLWVSGCLQLHLLCRTKNDDCALTEARRARGDSVAGSARERPEPGLACPTLNVL